MIYFPNEEELAFIYNEIPDILPIYLETKYLITPLANQKREKLKDLLKVLFKAYYEAKYSYSMAKYYLKSGINIDNCNFGFLGYRLLNSGHDVFLDPIKNMTEYQNKEWLFGYYANMVILRSFAMLDMSGWILNFLFFFKHWNNSKKPYLYSYMNFMGIYEENIENKKKVFLEKSNFSQKTKYKNIEMLILAYEKVIELYFKKDLGYKKYENGKCLNPLSGEYTYYNNIKHNYDPFYELEFTKRTTPKELYFMCERIFFLIHEYLNVLIKFINENIDCIIPSSDIRYPLKCYNFTGAGDNTFDIGNYEDYIPKIEVN